MSLSEALIEYASPTLAGIKVGSLFAFIPQDPAAFREEAEAFNRSVLGKGLQLLVIPSPRPGRLLCYLYRTAGIHDLLAQTDICAFLARQGYRTRSSSYIFATLLERLSCQACFPHEVGLFLGYPLSDVEAFIANAGQNSVCCGCWKAYGNQRDAQAQFDRCRRCTEHFRALYRQGASILNLAVAA